MVKSYWSDVGLVKFAQFAYHVATAVMPVYRSKYSKHVFTNRKFWRSCALCAMTIGLFEKPKCVWPSTANYVMRLRDHSSGYACRNWVNDCWQWMSRPGWCWRMPSLTASALISIFARFMELRASSRPNGASPTVENPGHPSSNAS